MHSFMHTCSFAAVLVIHIAIRGCIPDYECIEIFMCGDANPPLTITDCECFQHCSEHFVFMLFKEHIQKGLCDLKDHINASIMHYDFSLSTLYFTLHFLCCTCIRAVCVRACTYVLCTACPTDNKCINPTPNWSRYQVDTY